MVHKQRTQAPKQEPEEQEPAEVVAQDTPAADKTEDKLAEIDTALAEGTAPTEAEAEEEFRGLQNRWFTKLNREATDADIEAFDQKFRHLGLYVGWCCSGPRLEKRS